MEKAHCTLDAARLTQRRRHQRRLLTAVDQYHAVALDDGELPGVSPAIFPTAPRPSPRRRSRVRAEGKGRRGRRYATAGRSKWGLGPQTPVPLGSMRATR
jgi:hypothetical protein